MVAFLFKYNKCSYLQYEPQLVSAFHILLVVHPIEFDNIGVVRKSFEDVVLCFNLLINILKKKHKDQLKNTFFTYELMFCYNCVVLYAKRYQKNKRGKSSNSGGISFLD